MNCSNPPPRFFSYAQYDEEYLNIIGRKKEEVEQIISAPFTTIKGIPNRLARTMSWFQWRGYVERRDFYSLANKRWYPHVCKGKGEVNDRLLY